MEQNPSPLDREIIVRAGEPSTSLSASRLCSGKRRLFLMHPSTQPRAESPRLHHIDRTIAHGRTKHEVAVINLFEQEPFFWPWYPQPFAASTLISKDTILQTIERKSRSL